MGEQLSDLADVCVDACLSLAQREAEARDGVPHNPDGTPATLCVIGLGKLGGRELGYHSDLDLIFLYSYAGDPHGRPETFGAARAASAREGRGAPEPSAAPLNVHFARVAQRLISYLALPLREGALYRIDTRLRPSSSAGPLVVSFEALARYHERGRPGGGGEAPRAARLWERQALLRARPVAGDAALFARAQSEVLEKSLFQPLDGTARAEEQRLARIAAADAGPLERGYRFLRRVESRVRIVRDRPIDTLPTQGRELMLLARRLGYAGARAGEELLSDYESATTAVRAAFLRVLGLR